ncbi:MAG: lactate utilization protein [Thermodesulfobacteriota bacterium]|nr:lactate utilization protein [Thermodesulfobacteriota bacterium]
MTEIEQAEFIGHIRKALNRTDSRKLVLKDIIPGVPDEDDLRLLEQIKGRSKKMAFALLKQVAETGRLLNMVVIEEKDAASTAAAISRIAVEKKPEWGDKKMVVAWDHPLVRSLELSAQLQAHDIPVYYPDIKSGEKWKKEFGRRAAGSFIGVTSADYCIAQTATLTMKSRIGQPRCVSLLPSIHIAVIRLDQILADLKELYTLLKWDPDERAEGITDCMTFITGPSKTADIEATLVDGAHGPRELYLFVLT